MTRRYVAAALVGLALGSSATAAAQDPANGGPVPPAVMTRDSEGRVTVRAVRVEEPPRVDGLLDERLYRTHTPITGFIQQDPDEGQIATEPTFVWIFFDDRNMYISARCTDSQPSRIVANDMRRDGRNVSQNDNLSVVIDTFHDRRNGYEFLVNAIGGAWDTQVTDERDANRDWNTVWTPRSRRDDQGWTVEMAIPFRSVRYRGSGPQTWGINVRRSVRWKNEVSYLSQVPRQYGARGILRFSQAATLVGLEVPPASLNLDVKPYTVGSVKSDRILDPAFKNRLEGNAGFDVKYGVTQSMAADFTYRTDFAQVEDDDQQVNLTRFSLLFPEKREFFLEGQGIFAFGGTQSASSTAAATNTPVLFFSRRIGLSGNRAVPIEAGARLTGKAGPYSVGMLDIQTDNIRVSAPSTGAGQRIPATNFAVVRLKRDILRRSYVGFIGTRRSPAPAPPASPERTGSTGDNLAMGVDASLSFFQSLNIVGYYAGTRTPGVHGDDRSHRARFDYDADRLGFQVERLAVGRSFKPEVGFLRRTNFIEHLVQLRVSRRPQSVRWIRKVNYESALDYVTDGDRRLENRQARFGVRTDLQSGDSWSVGYSRDFEHLTAPFEIAGTPVAAGTYHDSTARASYTLGPQRRFTGEISVARGGFYGGDRTDVAYRGRAELTPGWSVEPGVSLNWIDLPTGRVLAKLVTARSTLSFTPRLLTAALVQYNSTNHTVSTNIRFRWEYQPGSEIFLVYSDARDTFERASAGLTSRGLTLKVTRLFRF